MGKIIKAVKRNLRLIVQFSFTALTNGYIKGFSEGRIFTGKSKLICLPGLNCYSCPGALGSCPIGSLQATLNHRSFSFAFYVLGFLMILGALLGRFICGWLCPFGLLQDLLYKIPFFKKLRRLPGERVLKHLKYVVLAVFVIILPLFAVDAFGQGKPWFCEYICPSGTFMAGFPLIAANEGLRSAVSWLFAWKTVILAVLVVLSLLVYRPFCRYLCPLGAVYSLFNPVSLYRYSINKKACTGCAACQKACGLDIPVYEKPNSIDCIRCGKCKSACPHGAITSGIDELIAKRRAINPENTENPQ